MFLHKNCNADLFEAVGALELSLSQIKLLHHLDDQPRELSLKEAAEVVHVSMPAASRMVDDLVRRGFAQRREDDDDRRMKRVCLTEGGRTAIRRLNAARLTGLEQFSTHLTTTERQSLAQALEQPARARGHRRLPPGGTDHMTGRILAHRHRLVTDENSKWWTLGAMCFALFMIMLDNTVVNVALPSIQRDLHASLAALEWTVNAYTLTFAVLLVTGGRLGDIFGRRRMFIFGVTVFGLSSLLIGFSPSDTWLVGFRAVQGIGAAFMMPATLAIITQAFPAEQRGTAIGTWAGVSALALAIGPVVGGFLTEYVSWRAIFFINPPIAVGAVAVALFAARETRDETVDKTVDFAGIATLTVGLSALVLALVESNSWGWGSAQHHLAAHRCRHRHHRLRDHRDASQGPNGRLRLLPVAHVDRREHGRVPGLVRDVRAVLLPHALPAERPALLAARNRPALPALDDRDHDGGPGRGPPRRPRGLAPADDRSGS